MQNSSIFQLYLSYYYFIDPSISTSFSILKVKKINQNYLLKKERNYRYAKRCIENNPLMIARGKKKRKKEKRERAVPSDRVDRENRNKLERTGWW